MQCLCGSKGRALLLLLFKISSHLRSIRKVRAEMYSGCDVTFSHGTGQIFLQQSHIRERDSTIDPRLVCGHARLH